LTVTARGFDLQDVAGDRDDTLEHALAATGARPGSEIASRATERRALQAPAGHNPRSPRWLFGDRPTQPTRGLAERFTCRPSARLMATSTAATDTATAVGSHAE
jgi:hypothetical protein